VCGELDHRRSPGAHAGIEADFVERRSIHLRTQKIAPEGNLRFGGACVSQAKNGDQ
jgi:hypothetical protein